LAHLGEPIANVGSDTDHGVRRLHVDIRDTAVCGPA
jgi:hypothetical protein